MKNTVVTRTVAAVEVLHAPVFAAQARFPFFRLNRITAALAAALFPVLLGTSFSAMADTDHDTDNAQHQSTGPASTAPADAPQNENWAIHGQFTSVTQWHPSFNSPYSGPNSLDANGPSETTNDLTLAGGFRPWKGGEFWLNAEVDQGFGLSNTLGVAGFPSGEAYKVGANTPYLRMPRLLLRQVFPLEGGEEKVEGAANQLAGTRASNNVTLTVGKFSAVDIFDTNTYAHDPRGDFLNWAVIDAGAFDYAADAWGYTYGAAAEWTQNRWTLRGGVFQLSSVPNGKVTSVDFSQFMAVTELEERHQWRDHPGKVKLLLFVNRGRMGNYQDAVQLGAQTGQTPDTALVRHFQYRPGIAINAEQELTSELGAFVRASANDGSKEAYEFTEINRSLSGGIALKGDRWGRHDDTIGLASVINGLSSDARAYFAAGGNGILIGDGALNYGEEKIIETYYSLQLNRHVNLAFNYQHINNPAYNRDRGPVSVYGVRLHAEF
jgi:high affinity Mn2+ porin